jgi:hypothetical protein
VIKPPSAGMRAVLSYRPGADLLTEEVDGARTMGSPEAPRLPGRSAGRGAETRTSTGVQPWPLDRWDHGDHPDGRAFCMQVVTTSSPMPPSVLGTTPCTVR